MSLGFSELIRSIESEIKAEWLPDAINWADKNFDGAWSNAINRFDLALGKAIERQDYTLAKIEGDFYRQTVLELARRYREHKRIDEVDAFFSALQEGRR